MNFLKKKLKGHKKGYNDDDDDDYIPPVPPHPDDIASQPQPVGKTEPDLLTSNIEDIPEIKEEKVKEKDKEVEEEEVKPKAAEVTEDKESKEEWKFFLQLTQRVQETVTKTQTALEKIKETSAADDIAKQSEYDYGAEEELDDVAESCIVADKPENWLAFEETVEESNELKTEPLECDKSVRDLQLEEGASNETVGSQVATHPPVEVCAVKSLLDDFGFTEEPKTSSSLKPSDVIFDYESDYLDDPFDTSFVDISVVTAKTPETNVVNGNVDQILFLRKEVENKDIDPFDTSYVETVISESSKPLKPENLEFANYSCGQSFSGTPLDVLPNDFEVISYRSGKLSRYGSRDSIASVMSNPFLTDNDYYTPISSGAVTPSLFSENRRRRSSTNPFEQSPEDEFADTHEASAIAALTQDFCKAIGEDSGTSISNITTQEPFDPFATIVDDFVEPQNTSKRQSVTADIENEPSQFPNVFSSNVEASATNPVTDSLFVGTDYLSDLSDTEEVSKTVEDIEPSETQGRRRSSAFQMELLDGDRKEPPPKFDPLPDFITRKASLSLSETEKTEKSSNINADVNYVQETNFFDPFETVVDKDTLSPSSPPQEAPESKSQRPSEDFFDDVGQPNKDAIGIDNDAFEDNASPDIETKESKPETKEEDVPPFSELGPVTETSHTEEIGEGLVTSVSDTVALNEVTTANTQDPFDVFGVSDSGVVMGSSVLDNDATDSGKDPFDTSEFFVEPVPDSLPYTDTASFDAFSAKFDQTSDQSQSTFDPFASPLNKANVKASVTDDDSTGFDIFDPFAPVAPVKPPKNTPIRIKKNESKDSFDDDDEPDFKIVIKAKMKDPGDSTTNKLGPAPLLPPPPKTPIKTNAERDVFDQSGEDQPSKDDFDEFEAIFGGTKTLVESVTNVESNEWPPPALGEAATKRTDSVESPQTPLFDEDTSQPLEDFPPKYEGDGWEMYLRHPTKKKLTGNRYWKKIFVRLSENSVIQLYNKKEDNDPFQELPLQACYSLSEISAQQYDQYGKIFTVKLQYIFYRERVGVRKGQIAKVMQGQITSVGQIAKLGMPLEHAPQISQLLKLGTQNYDDLKVFVLQVEDFLFHLTIHRDRALTYKTEEIQVTVQDELYVEQTKTGYVTKQLARVRLFFLAFINGMPSVEVGINDMTRQGKEVVGRHDIIPVVTEEWIRLEACEFHASVIQEEFEKTRIINLHPPDACLFELMRFRVRPPKNRELPLQVSTNLTVTKTKVELRCEVLVPGCISRKHGQIPCEDICIRFHIPECWIYFFRTEKHLRYGSVKSASRRPGKIKGIERFLGATHNIEPTLLEASAGQAKYEHAFHALVWRIPRLPKEGQGAYTQQLLLLRLPLTSFDQIPEKFYEYVHVEFTMPATTVSHAVVRSISVSNENPPEKFVRYVAKHVYKVEVNFNYSNEENEYVAAAATTAAPLQSQSPVEKTEESKESDESD